MAIGFFQKIGRKFGQKTRELGGKISSIFGGKKLPEWRLEEIEELLYRADLGREIADDILGVIEKLGQRQSDSAVRSAVRAKMDAIMVGSEGKLQIRCAPETICLIGANGSGKTTSAAKLAGHMAKSGKSVLLGSCDTFRAAANEQLRLWAEHLGVEIVCSKQGADAAAVAYDALSAAISRKKDVLILDTAGRMHTKENLLEELEKVRRVLLKRLPDGKFHGWLVLDGHQGSNGIVQAKAFNGSFPLSGIVITKLDGSAKGGALLSIFKQMNLPIYFVGIGEEAEDLVPFSADEYLSAIVGHP
ncbi:MAG: signal recognition particle-docking protein FtsY [Puniceicoccales bacterium]|jgi:fused signal recognition particle receptor|nr:signal recognition particle-docking protein FtsY [Puniceicoccales bacterium]